MKGFYWVSLERYLEAMASVALEVDKFSRVSCHSPGPYVRGSRRDGVKPEETWGTTP